MYPHGIISLTPIDNVWVQDTFVPEFTLHGSDPITHQLQCMGHYRSKRFVEKKERFIQIGF